MAPIPQNKVNSNNKEINKELKKKRKQKNLLKLTEKKEDFSSVKKLKTVSVAIAGSIICNAQSQELKAYLAGQIARTACIYRVTEVVVFDDSGTPANEEEAKNSPWRGCLFLGRILQYLECPQYLRKQLFPVHKDLQFAGLLNPLDAPHHLRVDNEFPFREGVVTDKPSKEGKGSYVDIGLNRPALIDKMLEAGTRVTVKLLPKLENVKKFKGIAVPPTLPVAETGTYWGYNVRVAKSLSKVFAECPYKKGYDLTIGTSDKGRSVHNINIKTNYSHCIIVFGGVQGIEYALENDETLTVENVKDLFDYYVNTCPNQGSRTVRTEEAFLISMALLSNHL